MSEVQNASSSQKDQVTADPTQRGFFDAVKGAVLAMIPGKRFASKSVENYRVRVLKQFAQFSRFREGRLMELIKTRMAIAKKAGMSDDAALATINSTACWPKDATGEGMVHRDELQRCIQQLQEENQVPKPSASYVFSTVPKRKDKTEIESFLRRPDISQASLALSQQVGGTLITFRQKIVKAQPADVKPEAITYGQTQEYLLTQDATSGTHQESKLAGQLKRDVATFQEPPVHPMLCSALATAHPTPHEGALPEITVLQGQDVYGLTCPEGGRMIVQVASQYDGVESPDALARKPVETWVTDGTGTQGPRAALRSIVASAQRADAASSKDPAKKIPDTMREFLSKDQRMTELLLQYPELCRNGYLEPYKIMCDAEGKRIKAGHPEYARRLADLQALSKYIEAHQNELDSLAQWIKPESHQAGEDHPPELQVFCAAPSFQNYHDRSQNWDAAQSWWKEQCPEHTAYTEISKILTTVTYRATAKMGAIAAEQTRGQVQHIYLTQVGQGTFRNPPESLAAGFQAAREELRGVQNVQLYATPYLPAEGEAVKAMVAKLPAR